MNKNETNIDRQEEKKSSDTVKEGNTEKQHVESASNIDTEKDSKTKENVNNDQGVENLKEAYSKLRIELKTVQDKLRKKQECLVQVQGEKESQYITLR